LLLFAGLASAAQPAASSAGFQERFADYQRQSPGVPVWPSTCDCVSISFGFKDANGKRPVSYAIGDAVSVYGQDNSRGSSPQPVQAGVKGPVKQTAEGEALPLSSTQLPGYPSVVEFAQDDSLQSLSGDWSATEGWSVWQTTDQSDLPLGD
jgi:hypothetical protein